MKIEKKAAKYLRKMQPHKARKFMDAFYAIEAGNTEGLNISPMQGFDGFYRLRIDNYRAIYTFDNGVLVVKIGPRGDIYK